FAATPESLEQAVQTRRELGIEADRPVLGFVGRLTRDKGLPELLEAFGMIRRRIPDAVLLLVGSFESGDPVPQSTRELIQNDSSVVHVEFNANHSVYYHLMDVFVLPTHREGFPNAVLEAQAAERPVVTTRATGAVDSVIDGVTGLLVPVADAPALADAVISLFSDREMAQRMGRAGFSRVNDEFRQEVVWEALAGFYRSKAQIRFSTLSSKVSPRSPHCCGTSEVGGVDRQSPMARRPWAAIACKRALDLLVGIAGLVLLSPLLLTIAVAIRVKMGSPVFFRQLRPGYRAHPFRLAKFRTMTDYSFSGSASDMNVDPSRDAVRLTKLGKLLRRFSLDELPQLWNVISGSMSLVGPRPLLMEYLDRYTPEQARRHDVKPGITGWTQINGRNANTWEQKFAMDVWYVDHWSFWLDLRILAITLWKVVKQEGISQPGHATMTKFGAGRNS
ncbi:MAG: sugar transferase, partial [Terriglobales bacterium]